MKTDLGKCFVLVLLIAVFFSPVILGIPWLWSISWLLAIIVSEEFRGYE